jgi:hypothetical protein
VAGRIFRELFAPGGTPESPSTGTP